MAASSSVTDSNVDTGLDVIRSQRHPVLTEKPDRDQQLLQVR